MVFICALFIVLSVSLCFLFLDFVLRGSRRCPSAFVLRADMTLVLVFWSVDILSSFFPHSFSSLSFYVCFTG